MAKGNMFLGMSRGSVGDVTFYRGRGQQLARARNRAPKNPRSSAQIIQRMILATATKAYSRLQPIVNHSFQGVTYGGESQSYFLKRAMERIRNYVAASLEMSPASINDPLKYIGLAMPKDAHESGIGLLVSEGSIPSIEPHTVTGQDPDGPFTYVAGFGSALSVPAGEVPTVAQVLNAFGAQVGDQITLVCLVNGSLVYSRYVIDINATAEALAEGWESDGSGTAFDAAKTQISNAELGFDDATKVMKPALDCEAAAVIISRKIGTVWERSTQYLIPMSSDGVGQSVQAFVDLWSIGTVPVGVDSPYYLNNADE